MLFAQIIHLILNTLGLVFIILFHYNESIKTFIMKNVEDKIIAAFMGILLGFDVVMSVYFVQWFIERGKV